MKRPIRLCWLLLALALAACGTDGRHFKIDGRLLNINQGEFYVYSPDGSVSHGIDTIKVQAGRFGYLAECDRPMTLMIVFPNFTEQPVFAEPGKSVDINGDASHLKEMTVKGTKNNELMNTFREQILSASPSEMTKRAVQMAEDHPESAVAVYLVRRYLMATNQPDYATAARLLKLITEKQPDNNYAQRLAVATASHHLLAVGSSLPSFSAIDVNGKPVTNATLAAKPTVVVTVWATWNYNSTAKLRQLSQKAKDSAGTLAVVGICLDPDGNAARRYLQSNGIDNVTTVCDGRMVDGEMYNCLGLSSLPDNILVKNGRIAMLHADYSKLLDEL